jgi:hypothetical protein
MYSVAWTEVEVMSEEVEVKLFVTGTLLLLGSAGKSRVTLAPRPLWAPPLLLQVRFSGLELTPPNSILHFMKTRRR